jgi:hypothetical protein
MTTIFLWTTRALGDARRMYEKFGFVLVEETPHEDWGTATIYEHFELRLANS